MKLLNYIKKKRALLVAIVPVALLALNIALTHITKRQAPRIPNTQIVSLGPTRINTTQELNQPQTNPFMKYHAKSTKKMLERLKSRVPLSIKDESTKQRIVKSVNGKSSILITTQTFRVEYIESPDIFMVEIKTIDIGKGKSDTKEWLISQGFTPQGACELPVVYYLNLNVASQLRDLGLTFSPLEEGC